MQTLPTKLYQAAQVRELDRIAIEQCHIPGIELMNRAGQAAFKLMTSQWPDSKQITVFCGSGNNAGDGYIVARLALQAGLEVLVYTVSPPTRLQGDALTAFLAYEQQGGGTEEYSPDCQLYSGIIVDALLGTGLDRQVSGLYADAISTINQQFNPVIALDIPSGLNADTGCVMGCAVHAAITIAFIGLKQGQFTADAADYCGDIYFSSLEVPADIYSQVAASAVRVTKSPFSSRSRVAHKGHHGHVLVIGGDEGYSGAARLAAEAAARVGAGLVSVATRKEHAGLLNISRPELMCHGVENGSQLQVLLVKASVIVLGPGLGQSPWALELFQHALAEGKTLILDADGLNLLARYPTTNNSWVLTPHPGEAARLLHCSTEEIHRDRFAAVAALQSRYGSICLLKGAGTLITGGDTVFVSATGNPGMATAGMGDVLSGVIGGLIAQGMETEKAVCAAAYLHGEAADMAAADGERGLLAGDIMPFLRKLVNQQ